MNATATSPVTRADLIAWFVAALVLGLVIELHLLSALLSGLLVFTLVDVITPRLPVRALGRDGPRVLAVTLVAGTVIAVLVAAGIGINILLRHSGESIPLLLQKMAQIVEDTRASLPAGIQNHIPEDADGLQRSITEWLRSNAGTLQLAGRGFGRTLVHVLMGMIIGALLSLQKAAKISDRRPLSDEIARHANHLASMFRRVVFAQFWISVVNTLFTWIYLDVGLRLFGIDLPLTKSLVALTFFAGLLPIVGNIISNTAIVVVSLSQGLPIVIASLAFLVVIHKLEYFLNARIVGSQINARAWELLIAMLVMEAAFGISGLIAAPIFYAYFKEELRVKGLL